MTLMNSLHFKFRFRYFSISLIRIYSCVNKLDIGLLTYIYVFYCVALQSNSGMFSAYSYNWPPCPNVNLSNNLLTSDFNFFPPHK